MYIVCVLCLLSVCDVTTILFFYFLFFFFFIFLFFFFFGFFFFQAEDGIRDLVRSRGLGDVYKRQELTRALPEGLRGSMPTIEELEAALSPDQEPA